MLQLELHCCNEGYERWCYEKKGGGAGVFKKQASNLSLNTFSSEVHPTEQANPFHHRSVISHLCFNYTLSHNLPPFNLVPILYQFLKYSLSVISQHLHTLDVCILSYNYLGINFISLFLRFKSIIINWNHFS